MPYQYRYHKKGTIHYIPGCCYSGQPQKGCSDSFIECMTLEEAIAQLNDRNVTPSKCKKCRWPNDKNSPNTLTQTTTTLQGGF